RGRALVFGIFFLFMAALQATLYLLKETEGPHFGAGSGLATLNFAAPALFPLTFGLALFALGLSIVGFVQARNDRPAPPARPPRSMPETSRWVYTDDADLLRRLSLNPLIVDWMLKQQFGLKEAWKQCPRADWLLEIASRAKVPADVLGLAIDDCL